MDVIYNMLDEDQRAKIYTWFNDVVQPKILERQKGLDSHLTNNGTEPYYGAIGGGLTYSFTPTGLGMIVKVKCAVTEEELDVTDYDSW